MRFWLIRALMSLPPLLAALVACGCAAPTPETLHVATINLAHGRGVSTNPLAQISRSRRTLEENLTAIAACLKREAPDVVAFQEADAASDWSGDFDHVAFLAQAAGYPYRHHGLHMDFDRAGLKLHYGTALLSRRPLANPRSHDFDAALIDARKGYVSADIEFAGRPVVIVSLHLDSVFAARRCSQVIELIKQLRGNREPGRTEPRPAPERSGRWPAGDRHEPDAAAGPEGSRPALIVMGDCNTTWERADDAVRLIAKELNLRPFEPESDQRDTYPSTDPQRRIDWILISSELRFHHHHRWPDKLSDHVGVMAELAWR